MEPIRNIATAVTLALLLWAGNSLQEMKISLAVLSYKVAQIEKQYEGKQYANLTH